MRYQSQQSPEKRELTESIKAIAFARRRFGCRRVHQWLRHKGAEVNHKKVYRETGPAVRKGMMVERQPLVLPDAPNHTWSMDFVMDSLANGRRIKCLTFVDNFTKECLDIPVAMGISGE